MRSQSRKWLLSAALGGLLLFGPGAAMAQTETPTAPNEPKPGTRVDRKEDKAEARQLRARIEEERERLRADENQFGKNSPQARADRKQLRADRRALYNVREDRERDRRIAQRRQ